MDAAELRAAYHHEWILTNRLGGYALGLGNLLGERKYDALLVAGLPGFKRLHVLASIEEKVEWRGHHFHLDSVHYPSCIHPHGYEHIIKSWLRPNPAVLYSAFPINDDFLILKEIFLVQGQNAVVVKFSNLGTHPLNWSLRPRLTLRDHHWLNPPGVWDGLAVSLEASGQRFRFSRPEAAAVVHGYMEQGDVLPAPVIFRNVFYPYEVARGYEAVEDQMAPVEVHFRLEPGQSARFVLGLEELADPFQTADQAEKHYKRLPLPADHPDRLRKIQKKGWLDKLVYNQHVFTRQEYLKILNLAAEDFLVQDDLIAGYPWFGPFGRDSLIALSGVMCLRGGPAVARNVLKRYGRLVVNGLLPNCFSENGQVLNYESVDAPLWYVVRSFEFFPEDKELFRRSLSVVLNYLYNDTLPFFVDHDGLIELRPGPHALTWMDAKLYDQPVTPRLGKPVEVNALWYNALLGLAEMARRQGFAPGEVLPEGEYQIRLDGLTELAETVKESLQGFLGESYLADRLIAEGPPVFEIRPNAVVALSLPFDWLEREDMLKVFNTAREVLLTPKGLRTLSPDHPAFKKRYIGNQKQRDLAYHQGTVWAWLLGPMVKLYYKLHKNEKDRRDLAREMGGFVWRFRSAFMKNHVASVAEVWDGVDAQYPKGCPAQAWSVMALLEVETLINSLEDKT